MRSLLAGVLLLATTAGFSQDSDTEIEPITIICGTGLCNDADTSLVDWRDNAPWELPASYWRNHLWLDKNQRILHLVDALQQAPQFSSKTATADVLYYELLKVADSGRLKKLRADPEIRKKLVQCCSPFFLSQALAGAQPEDIKTTDEQLHMLDSLPVNDDISDISYRDLIRAMSLTTDTEQAKSWLQHSHFYVRLSALYALTRLVKGDELFELALPLSKDTSTIPTEVSDSCGLIVDDHYISVAALELTADYLTDAQRQLYVASIENIEIRNKALSAMAAFGKHGSDFNDEYRLRLKQSPYENTGDLWSIAASKSAEDLPLYSTFIKDGNSEEVWMAVNGHYFPELETYMREWWQQYADDAGDWELSEYLITADSFADDQGFGLLMQVFEGRQDQPNALHLQMLGDVFSQSQLSLGKQIELGNKILLQGGYLGVSRKQLIHPELEPLILRYLTQLLVMTPEEFSTFAAEKTYHGDAEALLWDLVAMQVSLEQWKAWPVTDELQAFIDSTGDALSIYIDPEQQESISKQLLPQL